MQHEVVVEGMVPKVAEEFWHHSSKGPTRLVSLGLFRNTGSTPDLAAYSANGERLVVLGRHDRGTVMASLFLGNFVSTSALRDKFPEGFDGIDLLPQDKQFAIGELVRRVFESHAHPGSRQVALKAIEVLKKNNSLAVQGLAGMTEFRRLLTQVEEAVQLVVELPADTGERYALTVSFTEETEPIRYGRSFPFQTEYRVQNVAHHLCFPALRALRSIHRLLGLLPVAHYREIPSARHVASFHQILSAPPACEFEDIFWEEAAGSHFATGRSYQRGRSVVRSTHVEDTDVRTNRLWFGLQVVQSPWLIGAAVASLLVAFSLYGLRGSEAAGVSDRQLAVLVLAATFLSSAYGRLSHATAAVVGRGPKNLIGLQALIPYGVSVQAAFEVPDWLPSFGKQVQIGSGLAISTAMLLATIYLLPRSMRGLLHEDDDRNRARFYLFREALATLMLALSVACGVLFV